MDVRVSRGNSLRRRTRLYRRRYCHVARPVALTVLWQFFVATRACSLAADVPTGPALEHGEPSVAGKTNPASETMAVDRGAELARTYCQTCHLFPEPHLLDKSTWKNEALPFMSKWLGVSRMNPSILAGGSHVEAAGVFPTSPILPLSDWEAIVRYYTDSAPPAPLVRNPRPRIQKTLNGFEVISPEYRFQVPLTTLVKIDPARRLFYLGDGGTQTLNLLDEKGNLKLSTPLESPPVSLTLERQRVYATLVGSVTPSDEPQGRVVVVEQSADGFKKRGALAVALRRPVDTVFADLNDDGREDFAVCGFGNYLGRFSWFENLGKEHYREHVLFDRPGAVKAYARDFNRDGRLDLVVMMAQAREGIYLFTNKGNGEFNTSPLVEQHPAFGSSHFEVVDFNGDGFPDLLATNGDNGEYASPLKDYHGIRLYLNNTSNQFHEAFFFPLNGAYRAMAADFDKDGDLDIAAISFFPDLEHHPEEGFVYLKNEGRSGFQAYSFPECRTGRWLTMDVNDLNGDGWPDIVLGSFIRGPNKVPPLYSRYWEQMGPSFVILKNVHGGKN